MASGTAVLLFWGLTGSPAEPPAVAHIRVSASDTRSVSSTLAGAMVRGQIHVFLAGGVDVREVRFYLDTPPEGTPRAVEQVSPFDFAGTAPDATSSLPFDTTTLTEGAHRLWAVVVTGTGRSTVTAAFTVANPFRDADRVVAGFAARKMRFIDGVICRGGGEGQYADAEAQRGMMMLEKAVVTGTRGGTVCGSRWSVPAANSLILRSARRIGAIDDLKVTHGGGLNLIRIYLTYRDRSVGGEPLLTAAAELKEELRYYLGNGVDGADDPTGLYDVDLADTTADARGTENHQLQTIAAGTILAEVFLGETFAGHPISAYRDHYRRMFFRYFGETTSGGTSRFTHDVPAEEKDSIAYLHAYLGDLWALRDFAAHETVRRHSEIVLDRILVDHAEDAVKGLYSGYSGRHYQRKDVNGASMHQHVFLLFDNLGYTPAPQALAAGSGWGNWLHLGIVTSDYNPTSPTFPRAIIDLARNKGAGYLVQEGTRPRANWVEQDFALGFQADGNSAYDSHAGGFYVNHERSSSMGLHVAPFVSSATTDERLEVVADAVLHKNKPYRSDRAVVARRVAITKTEHRIADNSGMDYSTKLSPRIWFQDGFDALVRSSGWIFVRERSAAGREVYLAVKPAVGAFRRLPDTQDGKVFELSDRDNGFMIWETSTSEEHSSFAAFQRDIVDNVVTVTSTTITYSASTPGTTLTYNRSDDRTHSTDGAVVDWDGFRAGVHNPYVTNAHGSNRMTVGKGGYTARYDWDPDRDGDFEELPSKTVCNTGTCG